MIQKGVEGLRIISVKKTLSCTNFREFIHKFEDFYCHRNLYDLMIQKGKTGLGMIHSKKNFFVDYFHELIHMH